MARMMARHEDWAGAGVAPSPPRASGEFQGTSGDNTFVGTDDYDYFDVSQGGNDTIQTGLGDDDVYFGATLTARDTVKGTATGIEYVLIDGDYSAGLSIAGRTFSGVDALYMRGDAQAQRTYNITLGGSIAPRGGRFDVVHYGSYNSLTSFNVDGSAVLADLYMTPSGGNDRLIGGAGNDLFRVRVGGNDFYDGGAGFNRLSFFASTVGVTVDLRIVGEYQNTGGGNVALTHFNDVGGSPQADRLYGNDADNWLIANGGDDKLFGYDGDDFIQIGVNTNGDHGRTANTTVSGGLGTDIVDLNANTYSDGGATVDLNVTTLQNTGQGSFTLLSIEDITGTAFDDVFTGNRGVNSLFGGDGADELHGGIGNDVLWGDAFKGHNTVNSLDGPVVIDMNDTAAFADRLFGDEGNDRIYGGGGDDVITGGAGLDRLYGGAGNDVFVYTAVTDSFRNTADTIFDFTPGDPALGTGDRIDLRTIDANTALDGDQAFHLGRTREHVGDIVVTYNATSDVTTLGLNTDGDGRPDAIIYLQGNITLTDANFMY